MEFHRVQFLISCFFSLYINYLPNITTKNSNLVLYAYDTSTVVADPRLKDSKVTMNKVCVDINECFGANLPSLNFKK